MAAPSLQARMSQNDPRLYNVNRDVAHNFGFVITEMFKAVLEERWPALTNLAKEKGVTKEQLGEGCNALVKFVGVQADDPNESMAACLARCGWLDFPEHVRVILMAYLGLVTLGIHFHGVREATLGGQGPAATYKQLSWHGRRMVLLMRMGWFRRRLYRLRARLRKAWRSFKKD